MLPGNKIYLCRAEKRLLYITYNDGWTTTQNAKEVTASSTSILLLVMEEYLKYTGTGVTLYSLGFTAW